MDDISDGEVFEVTDDPSDEVFEIGYGASVVHIINDDKHISLCGSSRLINECFFTLVVEETEEETEKSTIVYRETIVEKPTFGIDGAEGSQGFPGIPGRDGNDGNDGNDGKDGIDGNQGEKGERGERGENGEQGPQGIQGVQGEQGPQGEIGVQGERGRDGEDGRDGSDGLNGSKGDQGVQGKEGLQGVAGKKGEPGPKGENGSQGKVGPKGRDGKDGKSGNDGKDGKDGKRGEKGDDGIVKVKGPLKYNRSEKLLTVSEDWINSLGSQIQGAAILGGGGDLLGVKQNGQSIRGADAVRYINFSGSGITVSSGGNVAKVDISHTT